MSSKKKNGGCQLYELIGQIHREEGDADPGEIARRCVDEFEPFREVYQCAECGAEFTLLGEFRTHRQGSGHWGDRL